jgi:hypothetical protein
VPALAAAAVLAGQALVAAIDPYNLYSWSAPRPVPEDAAMGLSAYLVRAVARGDYDTVMIGGSTAQGFRPDDMVRLLAGTRTAANLAYRATRPADLGVVMDEIAAAPGIKRVLVSLDMVYLQPATARQVQFPFHLYEADPTERLFRVDRQAYRLAARIASGQSLALPELNYAGYREGLARKYAAWHAPAAAAATKAMIERQRGRVGEPSSLTCRDLSAVNDKLVPFARRLASQGRHLDVIVPPYALAFYHWVLSLEADLLFTRSAPLESALTLRRCVVEALADIEGARVFAFDGERWLTDDLANYHDAGHVHKESLFPWMLAEIAAGRHRLTPGNFDSYAADLRARVPAYRYTSSGR